jgi:hypothetical protein
VERPRPAGSPSVRLSAYGFGLLSLVVVVVVAFTTFSADTH